MSEWRMLPVAATPEMKRAAVVYANGNAVYKNVAAEALEIEEDIYGEVYDAMIAAAPPAPTSTQYPLPDDLYDSKDWRSGGYAERVEWLHTMYENAKATLDTYLEMQAAPSAEPVGMVIDPNSNIIRTAPTSTPVELVSVAGVETIGDLLALAAPSAEPIERQPLSKDYIERHIGRDEGDRDAVLDLVRGTSYRQGWEDGRKEAVDPHRDAPSAEPRELAALLRRAVAALSEWHADHGIPDADATLMHDIRCAIDHRRIEPTTECTTCGAIVLGVTEPSEPVAFYVQRVAPGKRDDGMRLGPWWRKEDAEEWADERHVLRELHAHPAPAEPTAACVEAMRMALEFCEQIHGGVTDSADGTVEAITVWCPEVIDALRAQIEQIGGGR